MWCDKLDLHDIKTEIIFKKYAEEDGKNYIRNYEGRILFNGLKPVTNERYKKRYLKAKRFYYNAYLIVFLIYVIPFVYFGLFGLNIYLPIFIIVGIILHFILMVIGIGGTLFK